MQIASIDLATGFEELSRNRQGAEKGYPDGLDGTFFCGLCTAFLVKVGGCLTQVD